MILPKMKTTEPKSELPKPADDRLDFGQLDDPKELGDPPLDFGEIDVPPSGFENRGDI